MKRSASARWKLDIPALTYGIDVGDEPTPFQRAQGLAAEAWGARRTWWLVNGASQGNHVALHDARPRGHRVVTQRNAHSSTIDALMMSGLRPTFVAPELDPELHIAHCMTPEALDRALRETPTRRGRRSSRRPTSEPSPTWRRSPRSPTRTACRWWWTRPGARTSLPRGAAGAGARLGADLVVSSTHKVVGSLTQSAMIHLGHGDLIDEERGGPLRHARRVDQPERAAVRVARRGAPRAATRGRELLEETLRALARTREAIRAIPGLDVLDERLAGAPGVFDYDPLRLAIDVRGTRTSGYELARLLREETT